MKVRSAPVTPREASLPPNAFRGNSQGDLSAATSMDTMENCYSTVDITGDAFRAGGLAGANPGTMMYCYSTGRVGTDGGGLCGYGCGTVSCFWDVETSNRWEKAQAEPAKPPTR